MNMNQKQEVSKDCMNPVILTSPAGFTSRRAASAAQ